MRQVTASEEAAVPNLESDTILFITRQGMGCAGNELQIKLLRTYLTLLTEADLLPAAICFYTDGVKLVVESSPVLDQLQSLEGRGVRLICCSTCLDYFGLEDQMKVGIVGSMADIVEAQSRAAKVVTL
jgi:intracellular sulfur oxidation DsrE/DsrF family protein